MHVAGYVRGVTNKTTDAASPPRIPLEFSAVDSMCVCVCVFFPQTNPDIFWYGSNDRPQNIIKSANY